MNAPIRETSLPNGGKLQLMQGDLTVQAVDAIVNAANAHLQHGGGVAAAIARAGGSPIQRESNAWVQEHGPVSHAEPAYTSGGHLPCRYVIHAVGPIWGSGEEDTKLAQAVGGSLRCAEQLGLQSIAFPAISTGIFGFPKRHAAGVIYQAINDHFAQAEISSLTLVRITLFDQQTMEAFAAVWEEHYADD
jgi:O-acetyl-ADP-ribose deacetylase (regulator of RNase III)